MKKLILILAAITMSLGIISTGCKSSAQRVDAAKANVKDAKEDLSKVQSEANSDAKKAAEAAEWTAFKNESEQKINTNKVRIAELREEMKKSGAELDSVFSNRIVAVEKRNSDLKVRLDAYDKNQSNWAVFKRELSYDMNEIGLALKNLVVNNKN